MFRQRVCRRRSRVFAANPEVGRGFGPGLSDAALCACSLAPLD